MVKYPESLPLLDLPRLATAEDEGRVLYLTEVGTRMPAVQLSWIVTSSGESFRLPAGLLQFWALEVQQLEEPGLVEFGILPGGRAYAHFREMDEVGALNLPPLENGAA